MKKRNMGASLLAVGAVGLGVFAATGVGAGPGTLTIGVLLPLTGALAPFGGPGSEGRQPRRRAAQHRRQRPTSTSRSPWSPRTPRPIRRPRRRPRRRSSRATASAHRRPVASPSSSRRRERDRRRRHPDRQPVGDRPGLTTSTTTAWSSARRRPTRSRARCWRQVEETRSARARRSTRPAATTPTATRWSGSSPRPKKARRQGRQERLVQPGRRPASTPRRSRSPRQPRRLGDHRLHRHVAEARPGAGAHRQVGPRQDVHRRRPPVDRACRRTPARRPPRACAARCRPPSTPRPAPAFDALWKTETTGPAPDLRRPELRRRDPAAALAAVAAGSTDGADIAGRSAEVSAPPGTEVHVRAARRRPQPRRRTARTSTTRAPRVRSTWTRTATPARPTTACGATRAGSSSTGTKVIPATARADALGGGGASRPPPPPAPPR